MPKIAFTVVDGAGAAVEGASVTLYRQVQAGVVKHMIAVTDAEGQVLFEDPGEGIYVVYATKQGYVGGVGMWEVGVTDASGPGHGEDHRGAAVARRRHRHVHGQHPDDLDESVEP